MSYIIILKSDGYVDRYESKSDQEPYLEEGESYLIVDSEPNQYLGKYHIENTSIFREATDDERLSRLWTSLSEYSTHVKKRIDRHAGLTRRLWLSAGAGQEMTYLAKEAEARSYVMASSPDINEYPILSAEVGISGEDLNAVANMVIEKADAWRLLAAQIEAIRLGAKKQIDEAETLIEVEQIEASIIWPSLS